MKTTYLNGSKETPAEAVARIEQRLSKLRADLQTLHNSKKPENGFLKFVKPLIDRSQN